MSPNHSIWLLLVFATFGLAQDILKSQLNNENLESVIFQDVEKRSSKINSSSDTNIFSLLVSSNISVIINDNLPIRNSQFLESTYNNIRATSHSRVEETVTESTTKEVETITTIVLGKIEEFDPLDIKNVSTSDNYITDVRNVDPTNSTENNEGSINGTGDGVNESKSFQLESSSHINETSLSTVTNQRTQDSTDSSTEGRTDEGTTVKTIQEEEEIIDKGWDEDVTQYNDEYKTTIIFTNLFAPGDDTTETTETTLEQNKQDEMNDEDSTDRRQKKETKNEPEDMETSFGSSNVNQTVNELEVEDTDNNQELITIAKENSLIIENLETQTNDSISFSSLIIDDNGTVQNESNNFDAMIADDKEIENITENTNQSMVQSNLLSEDIQKNKSNGRDDLSENSTFDKGGGGNLNRTTEHSTSPSVILRIPPRKDLRTLIEERRRVSKIRRPSFRLNQTKLNKEPLKNPNNKVIQRLLSSKEIQGKSNDKTNVDLYSLEEELRTSWGGCARECGTTETMTCHYDLTLEWFHSMSKACYSCPDNITDCFRPHCIPTDGVKRTIAVINRSLPGPLIQVCEGDTIVAKVTNLMMESTTSIHWHGQHQLFSPHMDGVPSVTQCPILPGASFTYSFTAAQSGTHFYHSHSGVQRGDGAFGGLIVRRTPSKERHRWTYDHDLPQHTITILDWTHHLGLQTFTHHHHAGGGNKPDTILVNGRGIVGNFSLPPASFTVTKGQRYRFRLINAGVLNCPIRISLDDHRLTIIASDGNDIQPYIVDWLVTYAGERWDFVIEANAEISNYWMRFIGLMDCDERFTSAHQAAVLHYSGSPSTLPQGLLSYNSTSSTPRLERQPKILNALNAGLSDGTTLVHQLSGLARPQPWLATRQPDRKIVLAYDFNPLDNELFHKPTMYGFSQVIDLKSKIYTPQLNHISLKLPAFPLLTQSNRMTQDMLCTNMDQKKCMQTHCECTNIINIALGDVVEVIFIDQGFVYDANHPFHLHGHSFYVVGMDRLGFNVTSERVLELDSLGQINRNLGTPPLKDTVTVPDGGYTIIRFLANNPGYWLLHCHIDFHVEVGMAVVLKIGDEKDFVPAPRGFPTCGDFDASATNTTGSTVEVTIMESNRVDNGLSSFVDVAENPSFGSRWKYNTSSSHSIYPSSTLQTAVCLLAVLLTIS